MAHNVFNLSRRVGIAARVPGPRWVARATSALLTALTGQPHDYLPAHPRSWRPI